MMGYKTGDAVEVYTLNKVYNGFVMPSNNKNTLFLKLESGYNIGINKGNIKRIKILKRGKKSRKIKEHAEQKTGLPKITILHTGGTLASKIDYETGGVVSRFRPEELIGLFPEVRDIANIKSTLISQMFSEDMRFENYAKMAKAVLKEAKSGVNGIIISHGTDTMHYTSAALSFMFESLAIPVILVGAQRSSDRGSSDAAMNLVCAVEFINKTDFHGVAICMHESTSDDNCLILPGVNSRKMHTSRRDAFKAINEIAIARVSYKNRTVEMINGVKQEMPSKTILKPMMENKVGILKTYPNIDANILKFFRGYKGLVIEGTGLGHIGISQSKKNEEMLKSLKRLSKSCIIVMTSQCIFGSVNMNVYSTGRKLMEIGIIPGYEMISETAYIKLAWLLGNYKKEKAREMINRNLRGEIKGRLLFNEYLKENDLK